MWKYNGQQRPPFADPPKPGQESVWDYPRPPALVPCDSKIDIFCGTVALASTTTSLRVLETASPPTYYVSAEAIDWSLLVRTADRSSCEWKGIASYWALANDANAGPVGWSYENPSDRFAAIDGHASFYPGRVACYVDGERVQPQPGGFYGGWVTSTIAGPIKGEPGTGHW
jgi:uncharacterized protein (DUF427 family)